MWFTNIFLYSIGFLFILMIICSCYAEAFLGCFGPISLALLLWPVLLPIISIKSFPRPVSRSLLLLFSSRNVMVSGFTLKSLAHFRVIFVSDVRNGFGFILLHVTLQFSQYYLLNRLSFFLWVLGKDQLTIHTWACFWTLNSVPLVYVSVFMPAYFFGYCSIVI